METTGYIYMMTNASNGVLYTGVTNDLARRIAEHIEGRGSIFTQKYNCKKLDYFGSLANFRVCHSIKI